MNPDKELITENPFAILVRRMNRIEYQNEQILSFLQSKSPSSARPGTVSNKIDFQTAREEYYPNIPESTVRQLTAHLSRTKVGKRILLDRDEIEQDQIEKRRKSNKTLAQEIDAQFANQHQRKGERKSA